MSRLPVFRGLTTEHRRSIPKADRLAEVYCPDAGGRHGNPGFLLLVMRRTGGGTVPDGFRDANDDDVTWTPCKCGREHPVSWSRLDEAWHAADRAARLAPVRLTVADLAPVKMLTSAEEVA